MRFAAATHRLAVLLWLAMGLPSDAAADWLLTPFLGSTFGAQTTLLDVERGTSASQVVYGASVAWVGDGMLGVEGDVAYAPRFFERDNRAGLVTGSNVTTLMGSVLVTVPLRVTRDSLRPYVVGGAGLIHGQADVLGLSTREFDLQDRDVLGLSMGGGAVGSLTADAGVRFEVRHVRSVLRGRNPLNGEPGTRLRFWRATVGVTLRL